MKTFGILLVNIIFLFNSCKCQEPIPRHAIYICHYGDPKIMQLHSNQQIYIFKHGLKDGMYIAYYDKSLKKDTAMVATILDGEIEGILQRWSPDDYMLEEEAEYHHGKLDGTRKMYFRTSDGILLTNISVWKENIHQSDVQLEW